MVSAAVGILIVAGAAGFVLSTVTQVTGGTRSAAVAALLKGDLAATDLSHRVERAVGDRLPFRRPFRRIRGWVDFSFFRTAPIPDVFVGRSRWLFYRQELNDYRRAACDRLTEVGRLAQQLSELKDVVESSGRRLVFTVAPNKSTIYPEHVGLPRAACDRSLYDLMTEALDETTRTSFVRLDDVLRRGKAEKPVYFQFDTHWNGEGAALAARAIVDHVVPGASDRYFSRVARRTDRHPGDLARMMGLVLMEPDPVYAAESDGLKIRACEGKAGTSPSVIYRESTARSSSPNGLLSPVVVYHDSFLLVPLLLFRGAFERVDAYETWVDQRKVIPAPASEQSLRRARIVLVEIVERDLAILDIDTERVRSILSGAAQDPVPIVPTCTQEATGHTSARRS